MEGSYTHFHTPEMVVQAAASDTYRACHSITGSYCIMGDGCNMEGISTEACSLAGHWGLGKLIALYDDNSISIDGHTEISFTEDVSKRFEALGWHVLHVKDGNTDFDAIRKAIADAKAVTDKPTLIKVGRVVRVPAAVCVSLESWWEHRKGGIGACSVESVQCWSSQQLENVASHLIEHGVFPA